MIRWRGRYTVSRAAVYQELLPCLWSGAAGAKFVKISRVSKFIVKNIGRLFFDHDEQRNPLLSARILALGNRCDDAVATGDDGPASIGAGSQCG